MPLKTNKKKQQPIVWHQFFSISQIKFAWICSENIYVKSALRNCLIARGFKWNSSKKDNLRQESSVSREILQWIAQILTYVYHLINAFFLHLCKSALSFFSISLGELRGWENGRMNEWEDEPLNGTRAKSAPHTTNWYAASGCDIWKGVWVGVCGIEEREQSKEGGMRERTEWVAQMGLGCDLSCLYPLSAWNMQSSVWPIWIVIYAIIINDYKVCSKVKLVIKLQKKIRVKRMIWLWFQLNDVSNSLE